MKRNTSGMSFILCTTRRLREAPAPHRSAPLRTAPPKGRRVALTCQSHLSTMSGDAQYAKTVPIYDTRPAREVDGGGKGGGQERAGKRGEIIDVRNQKKGKGGKGGQKPSHGSDQPCRDEAVLRAGCHVCVPRQASVSPTSWRGHGVKEPRACRCHQAKAKTRSRRERASSTCSVLGRGK